MPTEAETRRRKKQDATRKRVALWLTPEEAKALDKLVKAEGVASRTEAIRIWLGGKTMSELDLDALLAAIESGANRADIVPLQEYARALARRAADAERELNALERALQQHIDIMTREHAEERAELEQDLVAYIRDVARIADAADVPFDEPAAMADDLRRKLASLNADRARLAALKEKCAPIADWTRLEELHGSTIGHEDIPDDERVVVIAGLLHIDLCSVGDLRELARAVTDDAPARAEDTAKGV